MAINTTNDRMAEGFADHRDETRTDVQRREDLFTGLDRPAERREDPVLDALERERTTFYFAPPRPRKRCSRAPRFPFRSE